MNKFKKIIRTIMNIREDEDLKQKEILEEAHRSYASSNRIDLNKQVVKKVKIDKD